MTNTSNVDSLKVSLNLIDRIGEFIHSLRPSRKTNYPSTKCSKQAQRKNSPNPLNKGGLDRIVYTRDDLLALNSKACQVNDSSVLAKISNAGITRNKKILVIIGNRKIRVLETNNISQDCNGEGFPIIIEIKGDGNCLFRCYSKYCDCTEENHERYRYLAVEALISNRDQYEQFINGNFDEHVRNMKKSKGGPEIWGTEAEIIALCNVLNMDTFIRKRNGQNWEWLKFPIQNGCNHDKKFITIQYESNHFSLISNTKRPCICNHRDGTRETGQHVNKSTSILNVSLSDEVTMRQKEKQNSGSQRSKNVSTKESRGVNVNNLIYIKPNECPKTKKVSYISKYGKGKETITLVSININGIRGKKNVLAAYLDECKPDIVGIQETKIDENISSAEIIPNGCNYSVYRKDRNDGAGGVMTIVRKDIIHTPLNELENDSESVWIKIKIGESFHYVGNWYRAPNKKADDIELLRGQLEKIENELGKGSKRPKIHILGDFNYRSIKWPKTIHLEGRNLYPSEGQTLINIMNDHALEQLVNFPTRENKILDLILSSVPEEIGKVDSPNKFSDHDAVQCTININQKKGSNKKRQVTKYNKGKYEEMRIDTARFSKDKFFNGKENSRNVEENWNIFKTFYNETVEKRVPKETVKMKNLPWITGRIRKAIRQRDKAHKKAKETLSDEHKKKWKTLQAEVSKLVEKAHEKYVIKNMETPKGAANSFWRYIKNVRKVPQCMPALKMNSNLYVTNQEKANVLNKQFSSVYSQKEHLSVPYSVPVAPKMGKITITNEGVLKLLKNLNPSKSAGPDDIHPRILKEISDEIAPIISFILQQSLSTNEIPREWDLQTICPTYKKGDKSNPANYRPISLTSIVCKMLEHIISSNIMKHMENHSLITNKQHAFRKYHSCETQLCTVTDEWAKELDKGNQIDVFLLDLEKAFDTVPHELLKSKLHRYGVDKDTLLWIDRFLGQRKQQVRVEGEYSEWADVKSGVPQGTVLGPLLFSIYMNDIVDCVDSEIRLFADDCVCYRIINGKNDCDILQKDINKLEVWANTWEMRFQPAKCSILQLTRNKVRKINTNYQLKQTLLEKAHTTKYLGVNLSSDLKWNIHVQKTCSKANSVLNLLRRNFHKCSQKSKELAYKSLVRPILEYASPIWNPYQESLQADIEQVHRRAARFVTNNYIYEPGTVSNIMNTLQWKSLRRRREDSSLVLFYKGLKGKAAIPTQNLQEHQSRSRNQRNMSFKIPFARTDAYLNSFMPKTIRLWNNLPQNLILKAENASDQINVFRGEVKNRQ